MNKLITSLACGTVLSMSLMGASYASNDIGSAALGGVPNANTGMDGTNHNRMMNTEGNLMNGVTGTVNQTENIMRDKIRTTNDNYRTRGTGTNNNQRNNSWDNNTTNNYIRDNTNTNSQMSPMANTTPAGRYRATSTTTNNDNNGRTSNWGWLGLFGLLGLLGMRSKSEERRS